MDARPLDELKYLTSHRALTKLAGVGRHVSSEHKRSLRGRFLLALLAIVVLIGAAAFAAYQIWDQSREQTPVRPGHNQAHASPTPQAVTLAITVTGVQCQVFVQVPGGDILVNRSLVRGQSVRFEESRLSVVLGDASAAQVWVNGHPRPAPSGGRLAFTITPN